MAPIHIEDLKAGDEIPTLEVEVGPVQMFYYSAAAYNGHRIHYDSGWTERDEGYPGLLVQGHLQAALLARAVTDWIGGAGRLVKFATQNRGAAFVGATLRFRGSVVAVRSAEGLVDLELAGESADGRQLMPGTATVALPSETKGVDSGAEG